MKVVKAWVVLSVLAAMLHLLFWEAIFPGTTKTMYIYPALAISTTGGMVIAVLLGLLLVRLLYSVNSLRLSNMLLVLLGAIVASLLYTFFFCLWSMTVNGGVWPSFPLWFWRLLLIVPFFVAWLAYILDIWFLRLFDFWSE